jgi:phosphoribosylaminoimidazolecarboxamide formyltransferase / IMP cyclohydrolase
MRALISVSDKTGIVEFCRELAAEKVEIISTGGTAALLKKNDVPCLDISEVTEFPEMLNGRVKTLHPKIHGGLLALRNNEAHMATVKEHGIGLIDIVVVNLYPFEETISKPDCQLSDAIENIDIGGPSMIRSASKNYQSVKIVVNPSRYQEVLEAIKNKSDDPQLHSDLAVEAFEHTAQYDTMIFNYLKANISSKPSKFSDKLSTTMDRIQGLRYGENPHQEAAYYHEKQGSGITNAKQLQGKELSFNNIIDLDAAYQIAKSFDEAAVTIIKHTNPCGTALAEPISVAYQRAFNADSTSAFGGIVGCNREVDLAMAKLMVGTFLEAVIAPSYSEAALEILKEKKNLRLLSLDNFMDNKISYDYKRISGGFLIQSSDQKGLTKDEIKIATKKTCDKQEIKNMLFAWKIVKHVKSNAIVIAKDNITCGIGAGQMNRVGAAEIALKQSGELAKGAVMASDAFFPFRDCVDLAKTYGITSIIQPGGSMRDQESIDACDEHEIAMGFTGIRHFKH